MQGEHEQSAAEPLTADSAQMPKHAMARHTAFMQRKSADAAQDWMQVDTFKAHIEPLTPGMAGLLHELTISVFWPHRLHDLELMLDLGRGYVALDEIGRPLGAAMSFKSDPEFAMLGMMVTTPRLQSFGTGSRLLRRVMEDCPGCDLRLSATRQGYHLYETAGFIPVGPIFQQQGLAREIHAPEPVKGLKLRPLEQRDLAALHRLDRQAYGSARVQVLTSMLNRSQTIVAEQDGVFTGFAMIRNFGKGKVIGPLVTQSEAIAVQMAAHFIAQCPGEFLRVDTPAGCEHLSAFLSAAGLGVFDTVTEMRLGRMRRNEGHPLTYGLAMQSLG